MTWFKIDDQFPTHPKVLRAGVDAAWLFVAGGCYCASHLTDGLIPKCAVPTLTTIPNAPDLAARLVDVGLWIDHADDFEVHDYLEYNPSRERVLSERQKRSMAGAMGAAKRWASQPDSKSHGTPHTNRIDNVDAPGPSPLEKRKSSPQADFNPTDSHANYARERGLNLEGERDHWLMWCEAHGKKYANVNAGFSTWLRQAVAYGRGGAPIASIEDLAEPRMVLPPARVDTCPSCESSLLACRCEARQTA